MKPHHNNKNLGMVACASHPNDSGKPKIEELQSRLLWEKKEILSPK
jgi:hypothetical protein